MILKKIKILNVFVIGLMVLFILVIFSNIYLFEISDYRKTLKLSYHKVVFGQYTPYLHLFFSVLVFVASFYIQRGLALILKDNLFNIESANKFRTASYILFVSGALGLIFDSVLFWKSQGITGYGYMGQDILILFIGIIINIVADVIVNGNSLKTENDLTI